MVKPGQVISHFRILSPLGSGGMGVVFKARDTLLNRNAAIKFLPSHLAADEEAKARFIQEAQAASALDHANICAIHEIGQTDEGELFIAMAYYDGETLKNRLKKGPLRIDRVMDIAGQLLSGLLRAHEAGIVHRDIKPANIMVTDRGEVKLLDFGLAKLVSGAELTRPGSTLGTVAYMSPEQLRGEATGPAVDVWSLGVVIYEMLAGRKPFSGEYEQAISYAILNQQPPPVTEFNRDIPPGLAEIIEGCLDKDPSRRPPLETIADRLADGGQGVTTDPAREVSRSRASLVRSIVIATGLLLGGLLLVAILVYGVRYQPDARIGAPPSATSDKGIRVAVLPFAVRGSNEHDYLAQGMVDILATKLDGAGDVRSVDPRAILGSIGSAGSSIDPARGKELAARLGADRYVLGSIVELGGTLQIRASLYDTGSGLEPVINASAGGAASELLSLVDELAAQILIGGDEEAGHGAGRIAAVTTESLPALKSYLQGEADFRSGRFRDALEAFQRATRLDSTFALAWYRVSVAAEWNAQGGLASQAAQRAIDYGDRLSRHDRELLDAFRVYRQGDALRAEQLYRTIVGLYPEDVEAWFQLGEVLAHQMPMLGRSGAASREAWERVLYYEPNHLQALWHLVRIPALQGHVAEMDSLINRLVGLNPSGDRLGEVFALQAAVHQDPRMERDALHYLENASEASQTLAAHFVSMYSGDPARGLPYAHLMTGVRHSAEQRALGHVWTAYLEAGRGHLVAADSELTRARALSNTFALPYKAFYDVLPFLPLYRDDVKQTLSRLEAWRAENVGTSTNPQSWFVVHDGFYVFLRSYLLGLLSAESGVPDHGARYAVELQGLDVPQELGSVKDDLILSLKSSVAKSRGLDAEALEDLLRQRGHAWYNFMFASPFVSLSRDRWVKGELLLNAGRDEEALRYFRSFAENSIYDTVFLAPAHLRQGRIKERQGDLIGAANSYRTFLHLWRDADASLKPILDEARKSLARIDGAG